MKVNCWEKVASKFDLTPQQFKLKLNSGMLEQHIHKGFYERRTLVLDWRPQKCPLSLRIWGGCLVTLITKFQEQKDPQQP